MPFPLAHPVAVLPLRRWCPRWFSFLGLVVGSIAPDAGYIIREGLAPDGGHVIRQSLAAFSHSALGSVAFSLPVGLLGVIVVLLIRRPLIWTLPAPHRQVLEVIATTGRPAWGRMILSVFIGVWSHIAFDALTHESAWKAQEVQSLQTTVSAVEETGLRFYQLLWIVVSVISMLVLVMVYARFVKQSTGRIRLFDPGESQRAVLWVALLVLPYLAVAPFSYHVFEPQGFRIDKHAIYDSLQPYLLLVTGILLVLGMVLRICQRKPPGPAGG